MPRALAPDPGQPLVTHGAPKAWPLHSGSGTTARAPLAAPSVDHGSNLRDHRRVGGDESPGTRNDLGMSIASIHPEEGPLARGGYLVIQFDPRNAHLTVHGDVSYAEANFDDAVADAQTAAALSASERLPMQYVVVGIQRAAAFRPV